MITRPLGLSEHLRRPPRSFDSLFFVNVVLLGLAFAFFGSRFVISPGVQLINPEFRLPVASGAKVGAVPTSMVIELPQAGIAFTEEGPMNYTRLADWLKRQRRPRGEGRVLIRADADTVPMRDVLTVFELVQGAGFEAHLAAEPMAARALGAV
ncbi:MAG TPA: hypothetical protein VHF69_04810, partial [Candidatus Synoicihabitans sp.]|nr:hypothetical protein [Candidatus Synoicihabitans sp.]